MNTSAVWSIELWAECPSCKEDVDLLDDTDFWDGRKLDIGENQTERSFDVEVFCPECGHRFVVDLEY